MANPTAPTEGGGLTVDLITDTAGSARLKLAVGSNAVAGASTVGGYQAVATHQHTQGSFALGAPVVTTAGVDSGNVVRANISDTDGVAAVRVRGAAGSFVSTEVSLASNVRSALPPSPLASRRSFVVQADSGNAVTVYVGDSGVTIAEGVGLAAGVSISADSETAVLYGIAAGAAKVRVLEVS
jgi:Fe-S cluster biogenesis protein NfuA